jgi:hypothetical protein
MGSFTVTTVQGGNKKKILYSSIHIANNKGSDIGVEPLYALQVTLYERMQTVKKILPSRKYCPCSDAIQRIDKLIQSLHKKGHAIVHAIVLMLDANQSPLDCFSKSMIKLHSIEWLRLQRRLDDPLKQLRGVRPNSTNQRPHCDIDYIETFGIHISNITTTGINNPCISDHLAIIFDIDIASHFQSEYSDIVQPPQRILTPGNKRSADA